MRSMLPADSLSLSKNLPTGTATKQQSIDYSNVGLYRADKCGLSPPLQQRQHQQQHQQSHKNGLREEDFVLTISTATTKTTTAASTTTTTTRAKSNYKETAVGYDMSAAKNSLQQQQQEISLPIYKEATAAAANFDHYQQNQHNEPYGHSGSGYSSYYQERFKPISCTIKTSNFGQFDTAQYNQVSRDDRHVANCRHHHYDQQQQQQQQQQHKKLHYYQEMYRGGGRGQRDFDASTAADDSCLVASRALANHAATVANTSAHHRVQQQQQQQQQHNSSTAAIAKATKTSLIPSTNTSQAATRLDISFTFEPSNVSIGSGNQQQQQQSQATRKTTAATIFNSSGSNYINGTKITLEYSDNDEEEFEE